MSRPKIRAAWVMFRGDTAVCERCGREYKPALPVPINVFVAMANAFVKDHAECEEKER